MTAEIDVTKKRGCLRPSMSALMFVAVILIVFLLAFFLYQFIQTGRYN
jgi:hypothetical protein